MAARPALAVVLGFTLAAPPGLLAAPYGTMSGGVTSDIGVPVAGVSLEAVHLDSGKVTHLRTNGSGGFDARLEPGAYKLELQKGYVVLRGPQIVSLVAGGTTPADIVVADLVQPQGDSSSGGQQAKGKRKRDIVAVALFSAALTGAVLRAATVQTTSARRPNPSPTR